MAAVEFAPGDGLDVAKMPGHWLLARLGKRVLRPGGLRLTTTMIDALAISREDRVVEFAPGLGLTASLILARLPLHYTGVERDAAAASALSHRIAGETSEVIHRSADATDLGSESATIVCGEAILSMQTASTKRKIVDEAFRLLRPGGRYGIHELSLVPDPVAPDVRDRIEKDLSSSIHVGARPLTRNEWCALLREAGFTIEASFEAPMHLLRFGRLVQDEGIGRTMTFLWNVLRDSRARRRVLEMAAVFRRHQQHLGAIAVIARRP